MPVIDRQRFINRAIAGKVAGLWAPPEEDVGKLVVPNLGSVALSDAELKNALPLVAPGLVENGAAASLDPAKSHYINTLWATVTNLCTNPYAGALATTGWVIQDTPTTFAATGELPTLAGLPEGITTGFHVVGDSGGDGANISFPQVEGVKYRMSLYAHIASRTATGLRFSYDGSGAIKTDFTAIGGGFTRIDFEHTGPSTGTGNIRVRQLGAGAIDFYFTAVMIDVSSVLREYGPRPDQLISGLAGWSDPAKPHECAADIGPLARGTQRHFISWINPTDLADRAIFGGLGGANVTQLILRATPELRLDVDTSKSQVVWAPPTGIAAGQTSMVDLLIDDPASIVRAGVNGTVLSQQAETDVYPTGQTLIIGARAIEGGVTTLFKGKSLPFAVFPRALHSQEILDLYQYTTSAVAFKREWISDKLAVRIDGPDGAVARWAEDEMAPINVISDIEFSDEIPGGYKEMGGALARNPQVDYQDQDSYSDIKVYGPGTEIVWEGSLDKGPGTSGEHVAISPSALGYQYILEDDNAASVGFIDCDLSKWGEPSTRRKIFMLGQNVAGRPYAYSQETNNAVGDPTNGPGITFTLSSVQLNTTPFGESIYYSEGPEIGEVRFDYRNLVAAFGADANWDDFIAAGLDDIFSGSEEGTYYEQVTKLEQIFKLTKVGHKYLTAFSRYSAALPEGTYRNMRGFMNTKVIGRHGLGLLGTWPNVGFSAKQMLEYLIENFASPLTVDPDFMDDDEHIIGQAWYPDTPLPEIVNDLTKYGFYDWFVYHGKRFELRKPQTYNRMWRSLVAPSDLEEVGEDSQRLWRRIVVQFTDATGVTQTVGPPGSTANTISSELEITDPDHPAVRANRTRRDILQISGISNPAAAIKVGKRFLEEANLLNRSGSATLKGYLLDSYGVLRPVSQVKSGDWIAFTDAADTSYRKIVSKRYRHTDRSAEVELDAPASGMEALLERFSAALIPLGVV